MTGILIISQNPNLTTKWHQILRPDYDVMTVSSVERVNRDKLFSLIVLSAECFDQSKSIAELSRLFKARLIIAGKQWTEEQQVSAFVEGASGYIDQSITPDPLLKAVSDVINGELWASRQVVTKVLYTLMELNRNAVEQGPVIRSSKDIDAILSKRELDVAIKVHNGQSNREIASTMLITERTVKSHLTSIYQKLRAPNRLGLAVLFDEIYV